MLHIIIIRIYVYLLGPELSAIVEIALRGFGGTAGEILWGNAGKFWIVGLGGTGGGIGFPEGLKDIIEIDMSCLEKKTKKKNFFSSKKNIFFFFWKKLNIPWNSTHMTDFCQCSNFEGGKYRWRINFRTGFCVHYASRLLT